jgi:hypothetical protein
MRVTVATADPDFAALNPGYVELPHPGVTPFAFIAAVASGVFR